MITRPQFLKRAAALAGAAMITLGESAPRSNIVAAHAVVLRYK